MGQPQSRCGQVGLLAWLPLGLRGSVSTHHAEIEWRANRSTRQMRCGGWTLSRYETSSRTRGYTVTGIDRKSLHSNPHTCGGPGGGPGEVPPTCRCHLPRIEGSPIFVPDRGRSTVQVGGLAVRLMKRRGRHGLGGSCDGQNKSNSDQPDHCHLHMNLPMTHPIARTKPMGSWFSLRS